MTRRELIKTLCAGIVGMCGAKATLAATRVNGLSIATIIQSSFRDVLKEMRGKQPFVMPELNQMAESGMLKLPKTMGVVAHWVDEGYSTIHELEIPIVWSVKDEQLPEQDRIDLAASLMENAIDSHDDLLHEKIGGCRSVVGYRYSLSPATKIGDEGYCLRIYSLYALAPPTQRNV